LKCFQNLRRSQCSAFDGEIVGLTEHEDGTWAKAPGFDGRAHFGVTAISTQHPRLFHCREVLFSYVWDLKLRLCRRRQLKCFQNLRRSQCSAFDGEIVGLTEHEDGTWAKAPGFDGRAPFGVTAISTQQPLCFSQAS